MRTFQKKPPVCLPSHATNTVRPDLRILRAVTLPSSRFDGPVTDLQRQFLRVMAVTAEEWLFSTDLTGEVPYPDRSVWRRTLMVNQNLHALQRRGLVQRGTKCNARSGAPYRWQITAAGRAASVLPRPLSKAERIQAARDRRVSETERSLTALRLASEQGYGRGTPSRARGPVIRQLRDAGCSLDQIGHLLGVTRERIRQQAE